MVSAWAVNRARVEGVDLRSSFQDLPCWIAVCCGDRVDTALHTTRARLHGREAVESRGQVTHAVHTRAPALTSSSN
jgi:hypothetical protein